MFNTIRELKALLDEGLITQAEFDKKKTELLNHGESVGGNKTEECEKGGASAASTIVHRNLSERDRVKMALATLVVIAAVTFLMGFSSLATAHDKISNYYSDGEEYSPLDKNAYVGGDAYNYIINGTYFTGYSVQGMGYLVISTMTGISALFLFLNRQAPGAQGADEESNNIEALKVSGSEIAERSGEAAGDAS